MFSWFKRHNFHVGCKVLSRDDGIDAASVLCYLCWYVRKGRNKFIHGEGFVNPIVVLSLANVAHAKFSITMVSLRPLFGSGYVKPNCF